MEHIQTFYGLAKHEVYHKARTIEANIEQEAIKKVGLLDIVPKTVANTRTRLRKVSFFCPRLYVAAGVVVFLSLFPATNTMEGVNIGCKFETSSSSCIIKWDTRDTDATDVFINQTVTASCTQKFIEYNDSSLYDPNDKDLYKSSFSEFGECLFEIKTLGSEPTEVNITSTTDGIKAVSACGKPLQGCLDQSNTFFILRKSDVQKSDNRANGSGPSTVVLIFAGISFCVLKSFGS